MGVLSRFLLIFLGFLGILFSARAETYSVKIGTEQHVNVVHRNFLSFTVDPKHLFSSSEKFNSQERVCMASSLAPAYLRIAGPSTAHMTFHNTTITINSLDEKKQAKKFKDNVLDKNKRGEVKKLKVSSDQWKRFAYWAKSTGFDIVFAINNDEKTPNGMWDPNSTLDILSVADKDNVKDVFWQLGYECTNQSIDEYLNDLETLRVIVESFPRERGWRVVGGDVTKCLREDSKSDFKDYLTLSVDMMDAVLLNGNSSSLELERMADSDRLKVLRLLHTSSTPLWITEHPQQQYSELQRAADWMASLGYSARNGFSLHYRELMEEELYEPTLSFYMALLFKNLVGERVLSVDFDASQATLFAHCTSLRHKPVPGGVTLYGVNMDDEPARLLLKLSKREEGGEIMQFILGHDEEGNIVVNGHVMSHEGDIRPVVKSVRPYKTLLINLPAKSFGFWVLANTQIEACSDVDDVAEKTFVEALPIDIDSIRKDKKKKIRTKRFISKNYFEENLNLSDVSFDFDNNIIDTENKELKGRIDHMNNELRNVNKFLKKQSNLRGKRQAYEEYQGSKKFRRQLFKPRKDTKKLNDIEKRPLLNFIGTLLQLTKKNGTRSSDIISKPSKLQKNKINKKYYYLNDDNSLEYAQSEENNRHFRTRRSVLNDKYEKDYNEYLNSENEIIDKKLEHKKIWKMLDNIQDQLKKISTDEFPVKNQGNEIDEKNKDPDSLVVKTELSDDSATINFKEKPNHGLIKSTFEKVFTVLSDLNSNLNRFWETLSFLD